MNNELENTLLFVIDQTTKLAKQYAQKEFDTLGFDLTVEQWVMLKVVDERNVLSQNELAKETHRDPASITRTLDILQKKGLVAREPVLDNRRQYNIKLTKEGSAFVKRKMPVIEKLRGISTRGLSPKEIKFMLRLLYRMQNNMK